MNLLEDRSDRRRRPDHQSSKRVHDGEPIRMVFIPFRIHILRPTPISTRTDGLLSFGRLARVLSFLTYVLIPQFRVLLLEPLHHRHTGEIVQDGHLYTTRA